MILVSLKSPRHQLDRKDNRIQQKNYSESQPFFLNPRGVLVHRVRSVFRVIASYSTSGPFWIVEYWCENSGRIDKHGEGLASHPGSKLVCARCEERATRNGEKTSSEIVGSHVCVGAARAVSVCTCSKSKEVSKQ